MTRRLLLLSALLSVLASACDDDGGRPETDDDGGGLLPPACTTNDDCAGGLVCGEDEGGAAACVSCATDGDCDRAQECEPGTRTCVFKADWGEECDAHEDCPLGLFCVQGLCQPGVVVLPCGALGQCPEGKRCNGPLQVCEEDIGCYDSRDCPTDEVCNPGTLRCEVRCTAETQVDVCAARERCTDDGRCVECESDDQCGPGLTCNASAGRCAGTLTCFSDLACAAGLVCNRATQTCTELPPACRTNDDCLGDERCDLGTGRCVLRACQTDQDEPNDRLEEAVPIAAGDRDGLTICGTEEDWYALPLRRGDRVNVNVETDVLTANGLSVQLRDGQDRILDEDPFLVDAIVAADATYFLRLRTFDPTTRYALRVLVARGVPCDDDGREENDLFSTAALLPAGEARNLQSCPADPDWYVFAVGAGLRPVVRLVHDPLLGDLDVRLYDSDGVTLLGEARTTNAEERVEAAGVTGGRAFVLVVPGSDRTQNAYDLFVDAL